MPYDPSLDVAATLDSINDGLFAALSTLLNTASTPGPFASVARFEGSGTLDELQLAATAQPALLLALESDIPIAETTVATLSGGLQAQDSRSTWRVYIVVNDGRDDQDALKGPPTGIYALLKAVKGVLSALVIKGLSDRDVVWFQGARAAHVERGVIYAHVARFSADYPSDVIDAPEAGVPFTRVEGTVNFPADTDGPFEIEDIRVDLT